MRAVAWHIAARLCAAMAERWHRRAGRLVDADRSAAALAAWDRCQVWQARSAKFSSRVGR